MNYVKELININIYIIFMLTIYIIFFYIKNNYNNYKRNLYEEIILSFISFILIYLYYKYHYNLYILTINIILLLEFDKYFLAIFTTIIQITFIHLISNVYIYLPLYLIDFIIYIIYKKLNKNKMFLTNTLVIINTVYIILMTKFDQDIIIYILSVYIITYYTIMLKKRVKLYSTLQDIQNDKLLKTSIFKVTHEIKNPLAVIKGYLSLFDTNDKDKCERYIKILDKEVENALLVLKDFSDIHNMKIIKNNICFNELLIEIKETIMPFFNNKRINLNIDSEKDIHIYADYNRLKQVFINILKNSSEALDINGKIFIKTYKNSNKLIITIKDNGCGMSKETIDNLFTPFYSKKKSGSGLGLCLSKEIIEKHGGSIKYTSKLNEWTCVKIILPIN